MLKRLFQGEEDLDYHEHVANMLFMGTVVTFVVLTIYVYIYNNYTNHIKRCLARKLGMTCCHYTEPPDRKAAKKDKNDEEEVIEESGSLLA